jgi:hypothetical protein
MKEWNLNQRPSLSICPENYCFFWVPPKGSADLSGKIYDSFEEAISATSNRVVFLHGGCTAPFGPCKRATKSEADKDWYEPCEPFLRRANLPELFFCNPQNLEEPDQKQYEFMAKQLWK